MVNSAAAVDDPDKIESYGIWSGAGSWYLDDVTVSAIPEPSAFLLLGAGMFGLVVMRLRKKQTV